MSDPRETPANGRVAHVSLRGRVSAERFTEGVPMQAATLAPLASNPEGGRERELLMGEPFTVLEDRDGWSFGIVGTSGYVGYVASRDLEPRKPPTHRVAVARSYAKATPDLKRDEPIVRLPFGSAVEVSDRSGAWSRIRLGSRHLWCPTVHLEPVETRHPDPVAIAALFLGTPYLWGGNSAFGIDCSGLIQAACHACGIACPGDSDQQERALGDPIGEADPPLRGDLWFWKGHVGILSDTSTLLHANAFAMSTTYEPLADAVRRIGDQRDGPVTARRRLSPPAG